MTKFNISYILISIIFASLILISYVFYNKLNDLRDYFLQRLYNYEVNIKEKFDNLQETYNNFNTTNTNNVNTNNTKIEEEKNIINQLYNDLEKLSDNELEYDTSPIINNEMNIDNELLKTLKPKTEEENQIPQHIEDDFKEYIEEIKISENDISNIEEDMKSIDIENDEQKNIDNKFQVELENNNEEESEEESEVFEDIDEINKESEIDFEDLENESEEDDNEDESMNEECIYMFKRGKNKGKQCREQVFKNNLCKKHYK